MTAVGDAGGGVELRLRWEFARFHPGHGRDRLPGAARVIGIHGPAEQWLLGVGEQRVVLLLGGDELGEEVRIEGGFAGQSQDRARVGVHGDDGAAGFISQRLLGGLLKVEIEGEGEVLAGH